MQYIHNKGLLLRKKKKKESTVDTLNKMDEQPIYYTTKIISFIQYSGKGKTIGGNNKSGCGREAGCKGET